MKLKTVGLAPKTLAAAALPFVAGVVLLLVDKFADAGIDDTLWWTLILSSPLIGGGTYAAPAAPTTLVPAKGGGEAGQGLIPTLMAVFLILAIIVLVLYLP